MKKNEIFEVITHDDCYVAFLDILGFKEVVENNPHESLATFYEIIENYVYDNISTIGILKTEIIDSKINCYFISDSIFLWTNDKSSFSFLHLSTVVTKIMIGGFMSDLPLRGGISSGALTIKKTALGSTLFGKGLTNAYLLENTQQWSGCIVEEDIIDKIIQERSETSIFLEKNPLFIQYDVPIKQGKKKNYWTVNWPLMLVRNNDELRKMFEGRGKRSENESVLQKIENTVSFYNESMKLWSDYRDEHILLKVKK